MQFYWDYGDTAEESFDTIVSMAEITMLGLFRCEGGGG